MTRYGYSLTQMALRAFVQEVMLARSPEYASLISDVRRQALSAEQKENIRGILADELVDSGLGPDDEPNDRGRVIEAAIDWLGSL